MKINRLAVPGASSAAAWGLAQQRSRRRRPPISLRLTTALIVVSILPSPRHTAVAISVEEAIVKDMFYFDEADTSNFFTSSTFCQDPDTTTISHELTDEMTAESEWHSADIAQYENYTFLFEMGHDDPSDSDSSSRAWKMRVGTGGNIYSLIGPYGEAAPPQESTTGTSLWVDDIPYMGVGVDQSKNKRSTSTDSREGYEDMDETLLNTPNFVHQAGVYMKDTDMPPPFFSPTLAKHCEGNTCTVASWGQQAHVPTPFRSDLLYFNQYRNCGSGTIEVTQILHNFADVDTSDPDVYDYLNVPWGGVRTSNLGHVYETTGGQLTLDPLVAGWGADSFLENLADTEGFTTFAQKGDLTPAVGAEVVTIPGSAVKMAMPCYNLDDSTVKESCEDDEDGAYQVLQFKPTNCETVTDTSHGYYIIKCGNGSADIPRIDFSTALCLFCDLLFVNSDDVKISVPYFLHWNWPGENSGFMYVGFENDGMLDEFNAAFDDREIFVYDGTVVESKDVTVYTHEYGAALIMPCYVPYNDTATIIETCDDTETTAAGYVPLQIVIKEPCEAVVDSRHSHLIKCTVDVDNAHPQTLDVGTADSLCRNCDLVFKSSAGTSIRVDYVLHWSWRTPDSENPNVMYFGLAEPDVTSIDTVNLIFPVGEEIVAYLAAFSSTESHSLTYIHGQGPDYDDVEYAHAPGRIRYGDAARDYTVFTVNGMLSINSAQSFISRQFLLTDTLANVESRASPLLNEIAEDRLDPNDFNGRAIELYRSCDLTSFGAAAADAAQGTFTSCLQGSVVCSGSSTPSSGHVPFFSIECGGESYFGPDQYAFTSIQNVANDPLRAYACDGQDESVRPNWALVGFFKPKCESEVANVPYDPDFCANEPSPMCTDPYSTQAESYTNTSFEVGTSLIEIKNPTKYIDLYGGGNYVMYSDIALKAAGTYNMVRISYSKKNKVRDVEGIKLYFGEKDTAANLLAEGDFSSTSSWTNFTTVELELNEMSGTNVLYIVITGGAKKKIVRLDSFEFYNSVAA